MTKLEFPKKSLVVFAVATAMALIFAAPIPALAQTQTVGLFLNDTSSFEGYTLFIGGLSANLIDQNGRLVHSWEFDYPPGGAIYLLENGLLLWSTRFSVAGERGAHLLKSDWDGNIVWDWKDTNSAFEQHHDIEPLPNGNVLVLARDFKPIAEVVAAGRDTSNHNYDTIWSEMIIEVEPSGPTSGNIVWEWRAWDHMTQDYDSTKENYAVVEEHPELIDLNFTVANTTPARDWLHSNGIGYSQALDQIIISHRTISEIWIIDHNTTTAEAAGHAGGNNGMGGDILYRLGNPVAYRAGVSADQMLFKQHNPQWIGAGIPAEGNILVFNNGNGRGYTSIDEIVSTVDENGNYPLPAPGTPHGPSTPVWTYVADPPESFYAGLISGTQRLPNGNTLICSGLLGDFFEVNTSGEIVWRYIKPIGVTGPITQGDNPIGNSAFRCTRYGVDYPGLAGKDLTPTGPLELYPITIRSTTHRPDNLSPLDSFFIVTAFISSPSGIATAELYINTGSGEFPLMMYDDGLHWDGAAGDSLFGVAVARPSDSSILISYYVSVEDNAAEIVNDPPNPPQTVYRLTFGILCGNIDGLSGSSSTNILDLTFIVDFIFRGGPIPPSIDAANVDGIVSPGGNHVDILDLVYVVDYLFRGGPPAVCA